MANEEKLEQSLVSQADDAVDVDKDYIRVVDQYGVSYKDDMALVAKIFIEEYGDSILFGNSAKTVKQAFTDVALEINADRASINTNTSDISDINTRICTLSELESIEEKLNIEQGE